MRLEAVKLLALVFGAAIALPPGQLAATGNGGKRLVGTWRYELSTLRLVLSHSGGQGSRQSEARARRALESSLKPIRIVFKTSRTVLVRSDPQATPAVGSWTVNGRTITVKMTDARQKTPSMVLSPDGKRIHASLTAGSKDQLSVDLVRVKG